jgi:beta-galactosidase
MKSTACCSRAVWFAVWIYAVAFAENPPRARIDLNGAWQFRLDSQAAFARSIQVPGCWQAQGVGEQSGILRHHYAGTAWYRKTVSIPESWKGKRVTLRIGGALRIAELFMNGKPGGSHDGMSAPFEFDVTDVVRAGASNIIDLRISNPGNPPGESPDKQIPSQPAGMLNYIGNWGGIYGPVELEATSRIWIEQVWVRPDLAKSTARFGIRVHNTEGQAFRGQLRVAVGPHQGAAAIQVPAGQAAETELAVPMPGARLWSPEHPDLYMAAVTVLRGDAECDRVDQRFGMREIKTQGSVLLLNGKPLYLRGYGDDNVEVLTGVPSASKEVYLGRLRLARSFGFNAVRFHSMTPVREYFEAADEVGMLVMAELPVAYTQYLLPFKDFVRNELTSVVLAHRNHPSWLSLALGNEFNLDWIKDENSKREFQDTVGEFYRLAKSLMPDRIVLSNDGNRLEPTDMMSLGRGAAANHPTVRHEFGEYYCSLPDLSLIPKFTGVMIPEWLEAKSRWVTENGLAAEYPAYLRNSQRLLQLGHKFQIERVRRDADVTGYTYWLIVDYPGGTGEGDSWEEGWFDSFWQPKGVLPEDGRELNSPVLPLIDAGPGDRTLWSDSTKDLKVLVSNYGDREIREGAASWRVSSDGRTLAESRVEHLAAPLGRIGPVSTISIGHVGGESPRKLNLVVDVDGHVNHWNFWAFPRLLMRHAESPIAAAVVWPGLKRYYPFVQSGAHAPVAHSVWITPVLDNAAIDFLESGGRVWLALEKTGDVTFFPASGGALGTVVREHPALQGFPHEDFCDLQFYSLMQHATPFPLDHLPKIAPIIGGIRTKAGFLSKRKELSKVGYVFEARVGAGRLLVTTLRIGSQLDDAHPEAVFLCDRLLRYCDSSEFRPQAEIAASQLSKEVAEYLR